MLKWAICEHLHDYLYYAPNFTVYMDNNLLTYVLSSTKLNATGLCWIVELPDFDFTICYEPGSINLDADTLSRTPACRAETMQEVLKAVVSSAQLEEQGRGTWLTAYTDDPSLLDLGMRKSSAFETPKIQSADVQQAQRQDPTIGRVVHLLQSGRRPTARERQLESPDTQHLLREWPKLDNGKQANSAPPEIPPPSI